MEFCDKLTMKALLVVCLFLMVDSARGEVDYSACLTPCMRALREEAANTSSVHEMCNVTTTAVNCITDGCQLKERNIPPFFYTYLRQLYLSSGVACAPYVTPQRVYVPVGVDNIIDALRGTFEAVFKLCQDFEDCLVSEMTKMWDDRESDTCLSNHAMKYCINLRCGGVDQQQRDNLITVFFRKMEEKGFRCDLPGLNTANKSSPPILPALPRISNLPDVLGDSSAVSFHLCGNPCYNHLVLAPKIHPIMSDDGQCSYMAIYLMCVAAKCEDLSFNNLSPYVYQFLHSYFNGSQYFCEQYATIPPYTPHGVVKAVSEVRAVYPGLFSQCPGFQHCLTDGLVKGLQANESTACNVNQAVKDCILTRCYGRSEDERLLLANSFVKFMVDSGYPCDEQNLEYPSNETTKVTDATSTNNPTKPSRATDDKQNMEFSSSQAKTSMTVTDATSATKPTATTRPTDDKQNQEFSSSHAKTSMTVTDATSATKPTATTRPTDESDADPSNKASNQGSTGHVLVTTLMTVLMGVGLGDTP